MDSALALHRFHFAFTATYHYLFPQLTMVLALLIAWAWGPAFRCSFRFGTNWAAFSKTVGGVIARRWQWDIHKDFQ